MLLITGPTGNTGREVVALLRDSSHPFRCMTRRADAAESLEAEGLDVVRGDFDDPSSLATALEGVDRAFLVCTPDEQMVERETAFIDAAREAGVERIVKISAYSTSADSASPNLRAHAAIEEHLKASGMDYTILRPHAFMQTTFWMCLPTLHDAGIITGSMGDGAAPHVDLRDVARVAVDSLTEDGDTHAGETYDLTGPEAKTMHDVAELLTPVAGKPVAYVPAPEEQIVMAMRAMGVAEPSIEHVLVIFRRTAAGELAEVSSTLEDLGYTPRTWDGFIDDVLAGRSGAATSFEPPAGAAPPPTAS